MAEKAMVLAGYHPWQIRVLAAKQIRISPLEIKKLSFGEVIDLNMLLDVAAEHMERMAKEKPK